ncbi:hypothetical protein CEP52_016998 [Fusarium oligoseptatum]|uniref:Uncharacterized protein n=1 Tax=Fusarium oligoseptatum TaxID=2604345 RepID=A0A428RXP7_9HYPO|nr:hypothetical protein CEP52_016998 [Fusarium oligoseptatum]
MGIQNLADWAPFQIDALGLVTIFGAGEVNRSIGNLVQSWVTEYLPVLGTHIIASNDIVAPIPGFVLYNITDGIVATDITPWFARWLQSYPLTYTATTITLRVDGKPMPYIQHSISLVLGVLTFAPLVILTIIMGDGWGIADFTAILITVAVRQLLLRELRSSIDRAIDNLEDARDGNVKVFLTLPDGRAVTILGPRMVVVNVLLTDPHPSRPRFYLALRLLAWLAFGAHAISLGMSTLFHQILAVIALLLGTFLAGSHVGDRNAFIGQRLRLDVDLGDPTWTRSSAYARFNLTEAEEQSMSKWNLFPQRSNTFWWDRYRSKNVAQYQHSTEFRGSKRPQEETLIGMLELRIYLVQFYLLRSGFHVIFHGGGHADSLVPFLAAYGLGEHASLSAGFAVNARRGSRYHKLVAETGHPGVLLLSTTFGTTALENKKLLNSISTTAIKDIENFQDMQLYNEGIFMDLPVPL